MGDAQDDTAQRRIADYALLSDSNGAALVGRDGSIDWACLPRFDSASTFARLLDDDGGHWALGPADGSVTSTRAYVEDTIVLRTEWAGESGMVAVTDALVFQPRARGHEIGEDSPHTIVRLVEGISGSMRMRMHLAPRPEYGLTVPRWEHRPGGAQYLGGSLSGVLSSPVDVDLSGGDARAEFDVSEGDRLGFALQLVEPWGAAPSPWPTDRVRAWLHGTIRGWQSWSSLHQSYDGAYADLVHHSGRVLQALTYIPSGAIVAAPTTSLPETIGGERNWDYRYTWVRDASMTLSALWVAACPDEVTSFFRFFATAAGSRSPNEPLQVLYGVTGDRRADEVELTHLDGFRGSRPVRVGNAAWEQHQLDLYGGLLDAAVVFDDNIDVFDEGVATFLVGLAAYAAGAWEEPDHGIWEMRGEPRHYLYSKLMCWVALDRAVTLADRLGAADRADGWRQERDRLRSMILERGWSEQAGAFSQAFDSDELDASALMIPIVGFLPADDERVRSTLRAIDEHLTDDRGLVYRYRGDDGLAAPEATFGICTYWLAHALALTGDVAEARRRFELVTSYANDVGLLAEEIDGATGELLGNFPQAFTHIGLVNAAWAITEAERRHRRHPGTAAAP